MYTVAHLGLTQARAGQLASAETSLQEAIKISEIMRDEIQNNNLLFLQNRDDTNIDLYGWITDTYRTLQQVLAAENKTDAALEVAEKSRTRAFVDLLAARLAVDAKSQPKIEPAKFFKAAIACSG